MAVKIIGCDTAKVYAKATGTSVLHTLYWGDWVDVTGQSGSRTKIAFPRRKPDGTGEVVTAYLGKDVVFAQERPLFIRFVDVGQGDGCIVETPKGKLLLIDGGGEKHIQRYMARAFAARPIAIDTIVVTHGDADHFAGLTGLLTDAQAPSVTVERVLHNGLAKRPDDRPATERFGATTEKQGVLYCTELVDDVRTVDDASLNGPFKAWKKAMSSVKTAKKKKVPMKRLAAGAKFEHFADEAVTFEVLGPIEEQAGGGPALRMLHKAPGSKSYSDSHTINGHSVVLRMTYGNVRFLFAADLNEESEDLLLSEQADLEAEVLKVPHHGSHEFSVSMLTAVAPLVSVVSAGDENAAVDYLHPRAVLVGALGKASRVPNPLILVTEMVAFFGNLNEADKKIAKDAGIKDWFRLARKDEFGIVHVRTDGKRLLVATRGANPDDIEAYAYQIDAAHTVKAVPVTKA